MLPQDVELQQMRWRGAEGTTDLSPRPAAADVAVRNVNFVYEQTNILYKRMYILTSLSSLSSL